jgi:hypothetical protein
MAVLDRTLHWCGHLDEIEQAFGREAGGTA